MSGSRPHGETRLEGATGRGGDIKSERFTFPEEYKWMDGRLVFWRPESRPSNVAELSIIENETEQDQVTRAYVASAIARQALTAEEIEAEIAEFREWEKREREQRAKGQEGSSD